MIERGRVMAVSKDRYIILKHLSTWSTVLLDVAHTKLVGSCPRKKICIKIQIEDEQDNVTKNGEIKKFHKGCAKVTWATGK